MTPKKKFEIVQISPTRAPTRKPPAEKPLTILDEGFQWTPPGTDIRERFKAMGWKPPKPKRPKFGK